LRTGRLRSARCALRDVHKSLKEFSKKDSAAENVTLSAEMKIVRHKAKKLRKRATALAAL
jgi:hypothetical protein